ncbi:MAG: ThiF family adenylyltransferase, partial [Candidatus Lokiarchaeota archaeon]|nr:ThiF family adenylyltransferase [Candidatus Lokiarchaeota archaeon]
ETAEPAAPPETAEPAAPPETAEPAAPPETAETAAPPEPAETTASPEPAETTAPPESLELAAAAGSERGDRNGKAGGLEEIDAGGEKCGIKTEEEINFQQERENLTWSAALSFLEQYKEDEHAVVSSKEREMYARQAILKGWNQQLLKKSRVLVAGMGKLGRELVKNLALVGVGHVSIVDPAVLESGAPPAFMMPTSPAERAKVDVVKEQTSMLNPFMEVETFDTVVEDVPLKAIRGHEIVVACINSFKSRMYLYQVCKRFGIPYVEGALLGIEGFVQAWMPGDEDKPVPEPRASPEGAGGDDEGDDDDYDDEPEDVTAAYFSPAYADDLDQDVGASNEAAASILAGILGQEVIKAAFKVQKGDIGDIQRPRYIKYDGMTGTFDPVPERKDLLLFKGKQYSLEESLLKKSTVFIAGVGALGCEIAKDLALAGVGKLILVDLDTIETSNLSRQLLFRMEDIGRPKAEVAAKRVKELNPAVDVEFYFKKIQDLPIDMYEKCDVIIAALDNVQARFDLNVIARRVKRPMIEGGTVGFEGHAQDIVSAGARSLDETACYRCVVPIPPPDARLIAACTPKGIPQVREHCVTRAEFIFRKKLDREPDLKDAKDLVMLTGASNKELDMLKERDPAKDHGNPFEPQDMENVLENKIPAIQTVSAVIASIESMEALKMACIQNAPERPDHYNAMDPTYLNYNGIYGIFEHLPVLKREDCIVCGNVKGVEYAQIPITPESTIGDLFDSLQKSGVITAEQRFMATNPATKGILFHPSIPSMGDKSKRLVDLGIKPGSEVLLTPFGVPKQPDGSEPLKYQVTIISVDPSQWPPAP